MLLITGCSHRHYKVKVDWLILHLTFYKLLASIYQVELLTLRENNSLFILQVVSLVQYPPSVDLYYKVITTLAWLWAHWFSSNASFYIEFEKKLSLSCIPRIKISVCTLYCINSVQNLPCVVSLKDFWQRFKLLPLTGNDAERCENTDPTFKIFLLHNLTLTF